MRGQNVRAEGRSAELSLPPLQPAVKSPRCIWKYFSRAAKRNYWSLLAARLPGAGYCDRASHRQHQTGPSEPGAVLIRLYQERWKGGISVVFPINSSF